MVKLLQVGVDLNCLLLGSEYRLGSATEIAILQVLMVMLLLNNLVFLLEDGGNIALVLIWRVAFVILHLVTLLVGPDALMA